MASAEARSLGARGLDRVWGRALGLPRATTEYTVTRGVRVPMRDGVELLADHYATATPRGTILVRTPYGRGARFALLCARMYAERGYHVILQSCRGTFGSGGTFEPAVSEIEDGADTVAWLRDQPWFDGRFATLGGSYFGFTQWAIVLDPPPELVTAVVMVGVHDFSRAIHGTGAFALNDFLGWSQSLIHQEQIGPLRELINMATERRRLASALGGLPLADACERLLAGGAPWFTDWLTRPDTSDPFWAPMQLGAALERVQVPVLLFGGWQDVFLDQTLEQYRTLRQRGVDVALTVGPWTHAEIGTRGAGILTRESLAWLAEHLAGTVARARARVRVHVTGAGTWRKLPDWPPASQPQVLHLQPGGGLGKAPAASGAASFTYDPRDPTPTVGGRLLSLAAGYKDDSALAARTDVLHFDGPMLDEDLEVCGTPVVELAHRSDNRHADLFVRLSEVGSDGGSRNVSDGFTRIPLAPAPLLRLELDAIAHRFAAGSRLRLYIAGGSHPRFARNLGTAEPPDTARTTTPSRHTIELGASRLTFPRVV